MLFHTHRGAALAEHMLSAACPRMLSIMGPSVSISRHARRRRAARVRSQVLIGYAGLARSLGLAPEALAGKAGLSLSDASDFDARIPADSFAKLLELSARLAKARDFGLQLAARRTIGTLGPLGVVMREEPDLRSALMSLQRFLHVHNEALDVQLEEGGREAMLVVSVALAEHVDATQFTELTLGAFSNIMAQLLGRKWAPRQVCFTHAAPRDTGAHRRFFRCPVVFNATANLIAFPAADLAASVTSSDAMLAVYAHKYLDSIAGLHDAPIDDRVRELIRLWLSTGECSITKVARGLGVDRRTVHRRLASLDTTFTALLAEVRSETAKQLLARQVPVTEIATIVGFEHAPSFTRWFHRVAGCAPSSWRPSR